VAVGQIILSSSNGVNWTVRDQGPGFDYQTVAYVNGEFIAVGAGGSIKISTNGSNWATRFAGASTIFYGVTYANGTY
jgi:hypothetical protein